MGQYIQNDFSGGMNLFNHDVNLGPNEYGLTFNLRNRDSSLSPVKAPIEDVDAPIGFKQGIYAFNKFLVLFAEGFTYYRHVDSTAWTQIADIYLDPNVDYIYTQVVPASTFNYTRKLKDDTQIAGVVGESPINVESNLINGTLAGLVVQDGINQGWIIFPNGTASQLQTYNQWSLTNRQYVPIMKQMVYHPNGILFGLSPDGKILYRSVSGRPLDFVINVNKQGNKGGDVNTTSYAVSFDKANFLGLIRNGALLIATDKIIFPVVLNYDKTIFQEPTFINNNAFSVGIVNQFALTESTTKDVDGNIFNDYTFIDFDGIRSFNAASAQGNEGRNSLFSSRISKALENKKQVINQVAAITFDDYSFFSLLTKYGNVLAIYDNKRQQWVSFDRLSIGIIKQFAVADQATNPTLYAITEDKVYKLYTSSSYLPADIYLKANTAGMASIEQKLQNIRAVFSGSNTDIVAKATEVLNGIDRKSVIETVAGGLQGIPYPCEYPLFYRRNGDIENTRFNFQYLAGQGWKIATRLRWQASSKVLMVEMQTEDITFETPMKQQAKVYKK